LAHFCFYLQNYKNEPKMKPKMKQKMATMNDPNVIHSHLLNHIIMWWKYQGLGSPEYIVMLSVEFPGPHYDVFTWTGGP
jgi:hypothetical protein